jgi:hypothetical protein
MRKLLLLVAIVFTLLVGVSQAAPKDPIEPSPIGAVSPGDTINAPEHVTPTGWSCFPSRPGTIIPIRLPSDYYYCGQDGMWYLVHVH